MPIYVSHVTLTREGIQELKEAPSRVEQNRKLWEEAVGKLLEWYVVLGDYDYLLITEAPDEKAMAEIAAKASSRGRTQFKTFTAIPTEMGLCRDPASGATLGPGRHPSFLGLATSRNGTSC